MSFKDLVKDMVAEALRGIACEIQGHPFTSKYPKHVDTRNTYEVLEDFQYKHCDQDINHGVYHFTKGEFIKLHPYPISMFMFDRSKLRKLI